MLGQAVEVIDGYNGKFRGVKIMMGKTKIINRKVNKVCPLELIEENEEIRKENEQ